MATVILDPREAQRLIDERRARGLDLRDEVWEGTYMMAPAANNEHQDLLAGLLWALGEAVTRGGLGKVYPGVNVARDAENWEHDYRVPDIAIYLAANAAANHGTFFHGGPDLAVEIVSRHDRTRDKIGFYAEVGTGELLIIDRDPWQLELLRCGGGKTIASATTILGGAPVVSDSLPLSFALAAGGERSVVMIAHRDGRNWQA